MLVTPHVWVVGTAMAVCEWKTAVATKRQVSSVLILTIHGTSFTGLSIPLLHKFPRQRLLVLIAKIVWAEGKALGSEEGNARKVVGFVVMEHRKEVADVLYCIKPDCPPLLIPKEYTFRQPE
jgi:hypothetical protein